MKKRTTVYRPRAACDIESIVVYIGSILDAPQAAKVWYEQLQSALDALGDMPTLGKRFDDDMLSHHDMRTYRVGQYRLFYTFTETTVTVWRVLHTRQDIDDYAIMTLAD